MRIKLAAIAKDESAYFPEWVFHHIYFGFDCIEIFVNNTSDNSVELLELIKEKYAVEYKIADFLFNESGNGNFQNQAYTMIYEQAIKDGYSHVMFLDIDEFWTPLDFKSSIKECLSELDHPEIVSFEWALHCNEDVLFSRPFSTVNCITKNPHVKTIFKTSLEVREIFTHNIVVRDAVYKLADGSNFESEAVHKCKVYEATHEKSELKPYYIFHRIRRSQIEYISLLGQGMRQTMCTGLDSKQSMGFSLKTNRGGYLNAKPKKIIEIKKSYIDDYNHQYMTFVNKCDLNNALKIAKQGVFSRFVEVVESIPKIKNSEYKILEKSLRGITLKSVINAQKKLFNDAS